MRALSHIVALAAVALLSGSCDCPERDAPVRVIATSRINAWVCSECPYTEDNAFFAAFTLGFFVEDPEVSYPSSGTTDWGPTNCVITGGASLGGCEGPPCAP